MAPRASSRAPLPLFVVLGAFIVVLGIVVVTPLMPRRVLEFEVTTRAVRPPALGPVVVDSLTVDARNEQRWRFIDLVTGTVREPPDTARWDLAVRRFHVVARHGARDLGALPFDSVGTVPAADYVPTQWGRDTVNPALDRWYRYSFLSHLLESKQHVYAVRTHDGGYAVLQFLSYYCPGVVPGCVTLRYAYRADGERLFP